MCTRVPRIAFPYIARVHQESSNPFSTQGLLSEPACMSMHLMPFGARESMLFAWIMALGVCAKLGS